MKLSLLDNSASGASPEPAGQKRRGEEIPGPAEKRGGLAERAGPHGAHSAHSSQAHASQHHEVPNSGGIPELLAGADAGRQGLAGYSPRGGAATPGQAQRSLSVPQAPGPAHHSPRHSDALKARRPPPPSSGAIDWASLFGATAPSLRAPSSSSDAAGLDQSKPFSLRAATMGHEPFGLRPSSGDILGNLPAFTPPSSTGMPMSMMGPDPSGPLGFSSLPNVQVPAIDWSSINLQKLSQALARQAPAMSFADKLRGVEAGQHQHQQQQAAQQSQHHHHHQLLASQATAFLAAQQSSQQQQQQAAKIAAAIQRLAPAMQHQALNLPPGLTSQLPNMGLVQFPNLEMWLQQQAGGFGLPAPLHPAMQGIAPNWLSLLPGAGMMQRPLHPHHDSEDDSGEDTPSGRRGGKRARNRTVRWTRAEHLQFLRGLELYGVGKWCSVGRTCVRTRTPIQIASHYQKFAARSNMPAEEKSKVSLLDETTDRVQRILKGLEKPDFPKGDVPEGDAPDAEAEGGGVEGVTEEGADGEDQGKEVGGGGGTKRRPGRKRSRRE